MRRALEELILNTDNTTFNGIIFHPGNSTELGTCPTPRNGRVVINGKSDRVVGMIAACAVRVDGEGFSAKGQGGKRVIALYQ